jgi:DNA-binding response OmpR family regulator
MKLLLVEDSQDVLLLLQIELTARGFEVLAAERAETALALAVREKPAVVVSDLGLPGMDGLELARALRTHPALRDTRAIAVSGFGTARDTAEARAAGYDAVLIKPVETSQLVQAIERVSGKAGGAVGRSNETGQ